MANHRPCIRHGPQAALTTAALPSGGAWRVPSPEELFGLHDAISADTGCCDCTGDQSLFEDAQLAYPTTDTHWGGQP